MAVQVLIRMDHTVIVTPRRRAKGAKRKYRYNLELQERSHCPSNINSFVFHNWLTFLFWPSLILRFGEVISGRSFVFITPLQRKKIESVSGKMKNLS